MNERLQRVEAERSSGTAYSARQSADTISLGQAGPTTAVEARPGLQASRDSFTRPLESTHNILQGEELFRDALGTIWKPQPDGEWEWAPEQLVPLNALIRDLSDFEGQHIDTNQFRARPGTPAAVVPGTLRDQQLVEGVNRPPPVATQAARSAYPCPSETFATSPARALRVEHGAVDKGGPTLSISGGAKSTPPLVDARLFHPDTARSCVTPVAPLSVHNPSQDSGFYGGSRGQSLGGPREGQNMLQPGFTPTFGTSAGQSASVTMAPSQHQMVPPHMVSACWRELASYTVGCRQGTGAIRSSRDASFVHIKFFKTRGPWQTCFVFTNSSRVFPFLSNSPGRLVSCGEAYIGQSQGHRVCVAGVHLWSSISGIPEVVGGSSIEVAHSEQVGLIRKHLAATCVVGAAVSHSTPSVHPRVPENRHCVHTPGDISSNPL